MEEFMNKLTDLDAGWWPFLHLRPAQNHLMSTLVVAKMSLHYGLLYGALIYLLTYMQNGSNSFIGAITFVAIVTVSFFVLYRTTFAYFWNCRAERLQGNR